MWGRSPPPLFQGRKRPRLCLSALLSLASPRLACLWKCKERRERDFGEKEREGGKAGSLCSCACGGLRITSEWSKRKEGDGRKKEARGGRPTGGCEAHSTNQTMFFLPTFSLPLSLSACVSLSSPVVERPSTELWLWSHWRGHMAGTHTHTRTRARTHTHTPNAWLVQLFFSDFCVDFYQLVQPRTSSLMMTTIS